MQSYLFIVCNTRHGINRGNLVTEDVRIYPIESNISIIFISSCTIDALFTVD